MTPETGSPAGAPPVDETPSLAESLGEMFGDFVTDESPASAAPDAGAPPADGAVATPENPAPTSEGAADAEHAGAPPVGAAEPVLDDPLKDAQDATYVVNGETRTFEGLKTLGDAGAIVTAEHLPRLLQRLSERDNLFERSQQAYAREQEFERLTAWSYKDDKGQTQTLTGREAIEAQRVDYARAVATVGVLTKILDSPDALASLLFVADDGKVSLNPASLQNLATQTQLAILRAEQSARTALAAAPSVPSARGASEPVDFIAAAPTILKHVVRESGVTGLTAEDEAFLAGQLPRYCRQATADDVRANPTLRVGEPVLDDAFRGVLKDRAALRSQMASVATTATSAANENARKLAAAARGVKAPTAAPRGTTPTAPTHSRTQDAADAWDMAERAAAAGVRRRAAGV